MKYPKFLFVALMGGVALTATTAQAQPAPTVATQHNLTGWYGYEGYHPFVEGKPWGLMLEGYWKANDAVAETMGLFGRIGLNYQLPSGHRLTGGYAVQYNYPYDDASEPYNWLDHRLWQQFLWRKPFGTNNWGLFQQRFRLEERWLERHASASAPTEWKFETTFRYLARIHVPLSPKVSLALYDELHLRLTPSNERVLDQNRVYAGLIFYRDQKRLWRLETGWMLQTIWRADENDHSLRRVNNTLRITITSDAPFATH